MNSAIQYLENTAKKYPNKIAIENNDEQISFSALRDQAKAIGTDLLNLFKGKVEKKPIIVLLPKNIESIVSFTGILYSGNIYTPLDYAIPVQRLERILENLQPLAVITDKQLSPALLNSIENWQGKSPCEVLFYEDLLRPGSELFIEEEAIQKALGKVIDTDPIYIMYTSGSTGVPKGVTISHRGVMDYADWVNTIFGVDADTIIGSQSAFYFDNTTLDIYCCLSTGATLVLIPETLFMYPMKIPDYLNEKKINFIFWVPTVMITVANSDILSERPCQYLKKVLFAGEVMPNAQLNIWRTTHPDLLYANLYGPTEITVDCTYYIVDREFTNTEPLPIGIPCKNMDALILNDKDEPTKPEEIGELCILGSGLGLGYWNDEEATNKAFVQNPLNPHYPERMYRTGDLAYWAKDGLIMYVGRKDSQIKLKGNRIELGDIEIAASSLEGVQKACVLFDEEAQEIVLFAETNQSLKLRQLNLQLKELVPKYMLPAKLYTYDALPLTPNGKIDRVKLKAEFRKH